MRGLGTEGTILLTVESDLRKQLRIELSKKRKNTSEAEKTSARYGNLHKAEKKNDILQVLLNAQTHSSMSEQENQKTKGKVNKHIHRSF